MLLSWYKKYSFESFFIAFAIGLALWFDFFLNAKAIVDYTGTNILFYYVTKILFPFGNLFANKILLFLYIFLQIFWVYILVRDMDILPSLSFLPVLLSFVFYGFMPKEFNIFLAGIFFILEIFRVIIKAVNQTSQTLILFFEIGFVWGLAVLFYPKMIILIFLMLFSVFYVKAAFTKDFLNIFLGFFIAIILFAEIFYLKDKNFEFFRDWFYSLSYSKGYELSAKKLTAFIFLAFIYFLSTYKLIARLMFMDIEKRIYVKLILIYSILILIIFLLEKNTEVLQLLLLPFVFASAYFFSEQEKNTFAEKILFVILILLPFAYVYAPWDIIF